MNLSLLLDIIETNKDETAIIWKDTLYTYQDILHDYNSHRADLETKGITNSCVAIIGDFTPNCIALLLALIDTNNIIVPFSIDSTKDLSPKYQIAEIEYTYEVNPEDDTFTFTDHKKDASHDYFKELKRNNVPGLVLFTSGTSGEPKGAVHDFLKLLEKFKTKRKSLRTVNFLLFDHWGGLNTLFHTLYNAGLILCTRERNPKAICQFIQDHSIELLPVSPTFLNLLILSDEYKNYDLSCLKIITYGTEPMAQSTLNKAQEIFPGVKFQQTYGLIELGVLRSKSKSNDSLWVKIGGEGYDLRVVDNILQIKAESAMMGYLNAPSPFTDDGYFITGDSVLVDGEYMKILGRKSELINVGGEKVYPQEVENTILEIDKVIDVTVYKQPNPLTGNIVCATIYSPDVEDQKSFKKEVKKYCRQRLQSFKVPVKIKIVDEQLHGDRFKKNRVG